MCVCVVCVFVIEENMFYFAMVMCELRCELGGGGGREGGGGRILDFRRNTNPSHLPLTSTRNWPKSLSMFNNHVTNL